MTTTWQPPRCEHGNIILGCPRDDCAEQNAYLAQQEATIDAFLEQQREEARELVQELLRDLGMA